MLGLEEGKCTFEEYYDLLSCEKEFMEEQFSSLDGSVEGLARRVDTLEGEKGLLEVQVKEQAGHLAAEEHRRPAVVVAMVWLLQEGIVEVVHGGTVFKFWG